MNQLREVYTKPVKGKEFSPLITSRK